ncbi:hypothetical protein [Catenuloplanes indicus]|uniref:Uncharacterized protein n=1 Tax=Catenuloplanes indicus TaxID=137267 RepID=A0AAE3VY06_9ACTN|nr:hypothetical protein [Catenuloplanes indicus]MDQ0366298.1 hypothetical protein [Catenuloplanes indicus]
MDEARLDTPAAIDEHLTRVLTRAERARYGVRFVLCDRDNRVRVHCPVDEPPPFADGDGPRGTVAAFAASLTREPPGGGVLVVLTRPGSGAVSASDRAWFHATYEVCRAARVRVLGVYLVTPADLREILLDDAL